MHRRIAFKLYCDYFRFEGNENEIVIRYLFYIWLFVVCKKPFPFQVSWVVSFQRQGQYLWSGIQVYHFFFVPPKYSELSAQFFVQNMQNSPRSRQLCSPILKFSISGDLSRLVIVHLACLLSPQNLFIFPYS